MAIDSSIRYFKDLTQIASGDIIGDQHYLYINRPNETDPNDVDSIITVEEFATSIGSIVVRPQAERFIYQLQASNWINVDTPATTGAIQVVEAKGDIFCAADPDGTTTSLIKSTDRGWFWQLRTTPTAGIQGISAGAGQVWLIITGNESPYVYRSTDDAETWSPVSGVSAGTYFGIDNDGGDNWCICGITDSKLANSTDNGVSFTTRTAPDANAQYYKVRHSKIASDDVFVATGVNPINTNAFARTTDNGATWSAVTVPLGTQTNIWIGLDSDGEGNWIAVAASGTLSERALRSTDNGATWSILTTIPTELQSGFREIRYAEGMWMILSVDNTRVIYSLDGGDTWLASTFPLFNSSSTGNEFDGIAFSNGAWVICTRGLSPDPSDNSNATKILRSLEFQKGLF